MMPTGRMRKQRGNALIEFSLVGIPLIFLLISIFEISRGMWIYHTLSYSVSEGTRFAAVHGINCTSDAGNTCSKTIKDIANIIEYQGVGLTPDLLTVNFTDGAGTIACAPLNSCLTGITSTTVFPRPAGGANLPGMNISISATYPFSSAIAMLWPGAGPGLVFPTFNLPASSQEQIQF